MFILYTINNYNLCNLSWHNLIIKHICSMLLQKNRLSGMYNFMNDTTSTHCRKCCWFTSISYTDTGNRTQNTVFLFIKLVEQPFIFNRLYGLVYSNLLHLQFDHPRMFWIKKERKRESSSPKSIKLTQQHLLYTITLQQLNNWHQAQVNL